MNPVNALNILADVNVDRAIVQGLRDAGHTVEWLAEDRSLRRIDDLSLMRRAFRQQAIILTNDTDFVGYVFTDHAKTHGVVLLRLAVTQAPRAQQLTLALTALQTHQEHLLHQFTTIYPDRVEQADVPENTPSA